MAAILNFAIFRNFRNAPRAGALAGIEGARIARRSKLMAHWQLDADGRLVCDWRQPSTVADALR